MGRSKLFARVGNSALLAWVACFIALQTVPAAAADQWSALPFASGWKNYANGYQPVSAVQNNPWWEIDLKKTIDVFSIAVFAPEGKTADLNGLVIAMSDTVAGDGLMWDQSGDVLRYRLGAGAVSIINPRKVIRKHAVASSGNAAIFRAVKIPDVRHIRIYRPGHGAVSLGEVKVFDGGIRIAK
tara:strand:+ start:4554 stop:5105 length:552 start_codon:yes stop_codon:yes gene_type:complete